MDEGAVVELSLQEKLGDLLPKVNFSGSLTEGIPFISVHSLTIIICTSLPEWLGSINYLHTAMDHFAGGKKVKFGVLEVKVTSTRVVVNILTMDSWCKCKCGGTIWVQNSLLFHVKHEFASYAGWILAVLLCQAGCTLYHFLSAADICFCPELLNALSNLCGSQSGVMKAFPNNNHKHQSTEKKLSKVILHKHSL